MTLVAGNWYKGVEKVIEGCCGPNELYNSVVVSVVHDFYPSALLELKK